jgi:cell pole-organizing protein PopZ
MEEILASIRRIISDENNSAPAQPAAAAPAPAPQAPAQAAPKAAAAPAPARIPEPVVEEEPDVLELTDMVEEKPQENFRKPEPAADVMFRDSEPPAREPAPRFNPPAPGRASDQLISQHTSTAVSSAFGALMNSTGDSRTVDDLVREMLRPMLKTWLDDNLPNLVERLVRAEIERVSRGQ